VNPFGPQQIVTLCQGVHDGSAWGSEPIAGFAQLFKQGLNVAVPAVIDNFFH
jgi:hypothetical protein